MRDGSYNWDGHALSSRAHSNSSFLADSTFGHSQAGVCALSLSTETHISERIVVTFIYCGFHFDPLWLFCSTGFLLLVFYVAVDSFVCSKKIAAGFVMSKLAISFLTVCTHPFRDWRVSHGVFCLILIVMCM